VLLYAALPTAMAIFSVSAHDIDAAGLALDAEVPVAWLVEELAGTELSAAAAGRLSARLSRTGHDVVVRGRVKVDLSVPCARCLEPTAVPIDTEIALFLRPAPGAAHAGAPAAPRSAGNGKAPAKTKKPAKEEDEYEFSTGEADEDTYDGETVVLDPFVREAILLEVPNFPLCSEGCPGIRPAAAEPPEPAPRIDPRLAPLSALRRRLEPAPAAPARPPARTTSKKQKQKKTKE